LSAFEEIRLARENLQAREGVPNITVIDSVVRDGQEGGTVARDISDRIRSWLGARQDVDAAIWTGLGSKWPGWAPGEQFTHENAAAYLRKLELEKDRAEAAFDRARQYICNTPSQIDTPLRRKLRAIGYDDAKLPAVLFEDSTQNRKTD
jgi:hypothetical protein